MSNMILNMINIILINLQVININSKHESSYTIIITTNHQKSSHTTSISSRSKHVQQVFFMLFPLKIKNLASISRLHVIYHIISSLDLKINMNHQRRTSYNIIIIHYPSRPAGVIL